jgi:hypothetical protein
MIELELSIGDLFNYESIRWEKSNHCFGEQKEKLVKDFLNYAKEFIISISDIIYSEVKTDDHYNHFKPEHIQKFGGSRITQRCISDAEWSLSGAEQCLRGIKRNYSAFYNTTCAYKKLILFAFLLLSFSKEI